MLDPEAPSERRDAVLSAARSRLEGAEVKHEDDWGVRQLAFEIDSRKEADYRYFRFAGEAGILPDLEHSLRITDEILRFRIFKVDPSTPTTTPPVGVQPTPGPRGQRRDGGGRDGGRGRRPDRDSGDRSGGERSERAPAAEPPAAPAEPAPAAEAPASAEPAAEAPASAEPAPEAPVPAAEPPAEAPAPAEPASEAPAPAAEPAPEPPAPESDEPAPERPSDET